MFVNGVALLSKRDNFAQFLDWVCQFEKMLIVPLPPTAQPLHKARHSTTPRARNVGLCNHLGEDQAANNAITTRRGWHGGDGRKLRRLVRDLYFRWRGSNRARRSR
jgi:hypothetical protein